MCACRQMYTHVAACVCVYIQSCRLSDINWFIGAGEAVFLQFSLF